MSRAILLAIAMLAGCTAAAPLPTPEPVADVMVWKRHMDAAGPALKEERTADAATALEAALMAAEGFGEDDTRLAVTRTLLALIRLQQQRLGEAQALATRAEPVVAANLGPDNALVAVCLIVIGTYRVSIVQPAVAEPLLQRAVVIAEKSLDRNDPLLALGLIGLGSVYVMTLRPAQAEPFMQRAALIADEKGDRRLLHGVSEVLVALAEVYNRVMSTSDADRVYRLALTMREKAFGIDGEPVAAVLDAYAAFLRSHDRGDDAAPLEAQARSIRAQSDFRPTPGGRR